MQNRCGVHRFGFDIGQTGYLASGRVPYDSLKLVIKDLETAYALNTDTPKSPE